MPLKTWQFFVISSKGFFFFGSFDSGVVGLLSSGFGAAAGAGGVSGLGLLGMGPGVGCWAPTNPEEMPKKRRAARIAFITGMHTNVWRAPSCNENCGICCLSGGLY